MQANRFEGSEENISRQEKIVSTVLQENRS